MGVQLHILDYVVFAASIVISIAIGAWYARPAAGQQTQESYLQGDRQLKLVPVVISLCVTYVSGITMIGMGAEMYYFGAEILFIVLSQIFAVMITAAVWVPLMYPLRLTSSNQYLRMRFRSHVASIVGMILQLVTVILICGVSVYAPSTLFEIVGVLPTWATLLIVGISSTLYTSLGGIKGVILTDVFQAVIMLTGLLTVIIQGLIKVGGLSEAWKVYNEWGRVQLDDFLVPNPMKRLDFWSIVPLQTIIWFTLYGLMQASVQRYSSLSSKKLAIGCVLGVIPGNIVFMGLSCLGGLVMFVYYAKKGCDPLISGEVNNTNQLLLYLVMEILYYPGVPGLFIAAIFCSSLSSLSSQLTAMAAFTWDDMLRLWLDHWPERSKTILLKVLVCIFGLLSTGVGFVCLYIKGTLVKLTIMFTQSMFVPLGILFISGAALPRLNLKGVLLSASIGCALVLWMLIGGELYGTHAMPLPLPTSTCPNISTTARPEAQSLPSNVGYTVLDGSQQPPQNKDSDDVLFVYNISHYWYGPLGLIIGLFLSCLFSIFPCFREKELVPENLVFPFVRCCFPTQKVSRSRDEEKEMQKMFRPDNEKDVNHNQGDSREQDPFMNKQNWLYESPQRKRMTSQS